jgi:hypothetical protein
MSKLVHNERVKYGATFLNSLSMIALVTCGVLGVGGPEEAHARSWRFFGAGAIFAMSLIGTHRLLGLLREQSSLPHSHLREISIGRD